MKKKNKQKKKKKKKKKLWVRLFFMLMLYIKFQGPISNRFPDWMQSVTDRWTEMAKFKSRQKFMQFYRYHADKVFLL